MLVSHKNNDYPIKINTSNLLQSGEIDVVNHTTGDRCHLKFAPYSYFSRDVARKVRKADHFYPPIPPFKNHKYFSLHASRWQVWWWTRMERPTTCCRARGTRRWSFPGWCRAVEGERTVPRANRRLFIKPSKPESCGRGTLYRKCSYYSNMAPCTPEKSFILSIAALFF